MSKKIVTVGQRHGDLTGDNELAIQAAVDYLSYIGGGAVRVGEGVYHINSAIHLRSGISLEGTPGKTIFKKCGGVDSPLLLDGDMHERQVTLKNPEGFEPGHTITVKLAGKDIGFHETVAVITEKKGNTIHIDRGLGTDYCVKDQAVAEQSFPVISGYDCGNIRISGITIDGNRENNRYVGGCRNAGIFLFNAKDAIIEDCSIHDYNGDGISYQYCRDIMVRGCDCIHNAGKGFHPGSGTSRTQISDCKAIGNGEDGMFVCWRVKESVIENCVLDENGLSGLSIGHKDTHNILRNNRMCRNRHYGILFRDEIDPMGGSFNLVENNTIEDNGSDDENIGYIGIRISGFTNNLRIINNKIIFNKAPSCITVGIREEENASGNTFTGNEFTGCRIEFHNAVCRGRVDRPTI